jgi:hypothetical protein
VVKAGKDKLASLISISISELVVSLVIVILLEPALIFLNSKLTPAFCLNTPTPPTPTLEAVLASPVPSAPSKSSAYSSLLLVLLNLRTLPLALLVSSTSTPLTLLAFHCAVSLPTWAAVTECGLLFELMWLSKSVEVANPRAEVD